MEQTNAERAAAKMRLLFELLQGISLEGFERSFKMSERRLLTNRFLIGIDLKVLGTERLFAICRRLDMPAPHLEALNENLPGANQVLFGFEQGQSSSVYKVYLEFWEKLRRELRSGANRSDPRLLHLGFKWDTADATRCAVARYVCHPQLSEEGILSRLSGIYEGLGDGASCEAARSIVALACGRAAAPSFLYLEVSEAGNPRKSFDVNLYEANLRLRQLRSILSKVRDHYAIAPERFDLLYESIGPKLFGHLAGGVDREGRDFLTTYYEESGSRV